MFHDKRYNDMYRAVLNNDYVKQELKEIAQIFIRTTLNECYPYIYIIMGLVLFNFVMICCIFVLLVYRRNT